MAPYGGSIRLNALLKAVHAQKNMRLMGLHSLSSDPHSYVSYGSMFAHGHHKKNTHGKLLECSKFTWFDYQLYASSSVLRLTRSVCMLFSVWSESDHIISALSAVGELL